jgi:hypothetical protein
LREQQMIRAESGCASNQSSNAKSTG